jgi:ubiquinone biosynthesis protein COQ4
MKASKSISTLLHSPIAGPSHLRVLSSSTSTAICSSSRPCASHRHPQQQQRPISTSPSSNSAYPGHIPINAFQKSLLAVGSAFTSLLDPYRHDMVAVLGETTSDRQLPKLRDVLLKESGEEGLRILKQRPRLHSDTIDVGKLASMKEGSLGRAYVDWLEACKVTPDTREPVSPTILLSSPSLLPCLLPSVSVSLPASRSATSTTQN